MSTDDSTDPTPRLSAVAVAVEQRLVDLGLDADCIEATRSDLAAALGISSDAVKRGLAALTRAERIVVERTPGGHSCFARPTQAARPARPARPQPPDPPDPLAARPPDPDPPDLSPRAGAPACDQRSEPSKNSSIDRDGNLARAGEPPDPADPPDRPTARPPGPAVIMAAVAAAKRLGKPPLDEALKTKLGSQAKRMHPGVSIEALEAAAVYLVEHDMTALDAAHRKSQAVAANAVGPLNAMGLRPTPDDLAALWEEAKASEAGRDLASFEPHEERELVEAWSLIHATWRNTPTILPAERAEWHTGLRPLPIGCILWSIREIAGTGERFAPTWGQVLDVGIPKLLEARRLRRQADAHQRREEA